jgi:hypothetical protein
MRQLDTCDFCGDAPEGVYEVVPASVGGGPKRLALCADCRETLQTVVDPLLDAASTAATTESEGDRATTVDANAQSASTDSGTDSGTAIDDAMDAGAESADDASTADAADDAAAASGTDDGVTIDAGDGREVVESERADDAAGADGAEDVAGADASDAAAGGSPARRPDGYAQIIRLLQNRDGAMPRDDLRALATNAYDLGGREFETALDAAVENGDVEETDSGLRTA